MQLNTLKGLHASYRLCLEINGRTLSVSSTSDLSGYEAIVDSTSRSDSENYVNGVALLQKRDEKGQRLHGSHFDAVPGTKVFLWRDVAYPLIKVGKKLLVAEPSRALLIFCEALVRVLAIHDDRPTPAFSHYINPVARDLLLLS